MMKKLALLLPVLALCALTIPSVSVAENYRPQVIGGTIDRRSDVKWVAAILYPGSGSRYQRQACTGSLVTRRYVLTAAHCVVPERPNQVLLGTKDLRRGGRVVGVRRAFVYPGYQRSGRFYGDMALLKLKDRVRIDPVGLVAREVHGVGEMGYIAGWGDTTGGRSYPYLLHSAWIPIQRDAVCGSWYGANYAGHVMICAGDGYPATCQGDSGGPLARRVQGRWRLVGVTSYGKDGCRSPNVYAWVGSPELRPWLRNRLGY